MHRLWAEITNPKVTQVSSGERYALSLVYACRMVIPVLGALTAT